MTMILKAQVWLTFLTIAECVYRIMYSAMETIRYKDDYYGTINAHSPYTLHSIQYCTVYSVLYYKAHTTQYTVLYSVQCTVL